MSSSQLSGPSGLFQHQPLDPQSSEIRLLCVEHDSDELQPIRLTVKHVRLADDCDFVALSYTWGLESPNHDVYLRCTGSEAGTYNIRQNLYDFFKEMRREDDQTWFWVDQICINQADLQEKSEQICRMSEIYSKARRVDMWLGPSFEDSDDLMAFITHYAKIAGDGQYDTMPKIVDQYIKNCAIDNKRRYADVLQDTKDDRPMSHKCFYLKLGRACGQLVSRGYFTRAWIVQEVALGSRCLARLGSRTVSWDDMAPVLGYLSGQTESRFKAHVTVAEFWRIEALSLNAGGDKLGGALRWMLAHYQEDQDYNWCSVFALVLASECADMRDKVFAIQGLLPERLRFYPDYTLEGHEIVFKAARIHIADRLMVLSQRCADAQYMQQYFDPWRLIKQLTADNLIDVWLAVFMTCSWYYEMHRGRDLQYDTPRLRAFLLNEVFPSFRAQRLASGSEWRHHRWVEKILARIVAPRERGLRFWYMRKTNSRALRSHISFTQGNASDVIYARRQVSSPTRQTQAGTQIGSTTSLWSLLGIRTFQKF